MISSAIRWAVLPGMANPTPMLPLCDCAPGTPEATVAMAVLMPITSPAPLTSAPPELPGLIAASVWMASMTVASSALEPVWTARPVALMIPVGHRVGQPQRRADRDRDVAHLHLVGVGELGRGEPLGAVQPQHGEVEGGVGAHDGGVVEGAVGGADLHGLGVAPLAGDDVVVGEHEAVGGEDDARPAPGAGAAGDVDGDHAGRRLRGGRRRGRGGLRVLDDDVLRRCRRPGRGGRLVDQGGHAGAGAAADQRAGDQPGQADAQPAGPSGRRRGGRRTARERRRPYGPCW